MNRNFRIITINGIRGILMAAFIISGLIAGFIISPAWVCMKLWNTFVIEYAPVSSMNLYQGLLLWAVIALFLYALNKNHSLIGFGSYSKLTPEQIKDIMNRTKMADPKFFTDLETVNSEIKTEQKENIDETERNNSEQDKEQKEEIRG